MVAAGKAERHTAPDEAELDDDERHVHKVVLPSDRGERDGVDEGNIGRLKLCNSVPNQEALGTHREGLYFGWVRIQNRVYPQG
jgi:hypothetical protein